MISSDPASAASQSRSPVVHARPGQIGREMGVEVARHIAAGNETITIRLDPAEMGKIEVRLSFDDQGNLRAVVRAESAAALDLLRRDSVDLARALSDAGVRADAQSFRFDSRSGGGGDANSFWQRQQNGGQNGASASRPSESEGIAEDISYRPLRTSGRIDLMA